MSIPLCCAAPTVDLRQVYRYLGCGTTPTPEVETLCRTLLPEFLSALRCCACFLETTVQVQEDTVCIPGLAPIRSKALSRNLQGCEKVLLFAATIGSGADRLRMQAQVRSPARAVVLDAMGTAAVEALCNELCAQWQQTYAPLQLRPRFSPGYGDLPLALQKDLLALLDSHRQAGIALSEGLLMLPQKSVSAIVGIGSAGCESLLHDCAACGKLDCAFRLQ